MVLWFDWLVSIVLIVISRLEPVETLLITTGATLSAFSFTAGTILIRRLGVSKSRIPEETWCEEFLSKAYSSGIDTNFSEIGTIVKRYVNEFMYHEFPQFGVTEYSTFPKTRPHFSFASFLSQNLGSSSTVDDKPQPIEYYRTVTYLRPVARVWWQVPSRIRGLFLRVKVMRNVLVPLMFPVYGRDQYVTVSYVLFPSQRGNDEGGPSEFRTGIAASWPYESIKKFQARSDPINHLRLDIGHELGWASLKFRRLPIWVRHRRSILRRALMTLAKQSRENSVQLKHRALEIRSLHSRILYTREKGNKTWESRTTVTFLFDPNIANHVEVFLTSSTLQRASQVRNFANSMLGGAIAFGSASLLMLLALISSPIIALPSLIAFFYGWYVLLGGLWGFRSHFVLSKRQENVDYTPQYRCPTCRSLVQPDAITCVVCNAKLTEKPVPQPTVKTLVTGKEEISNARLQSFVRSARAEYAAHSVVARKAVTSRPALAGETLGFQEFAERLEVGPELLIDVYSEGDVYTSPAIIGVGQIVAIREESYLVSTFEKNIRNQVTLASLSAEEIQRTLKRLDIQPNVVFVPSKLYTSLEINPSVGMRIEHRGGMPYLVLGNMRLLAFWSSNPVPFKNLIFVDPRLGEWVFKPQEDSQRFTVEVAPERSEGKFDVTLKTVAKFLVKDPSKGLIVKKEESINHN